ncbi:MAG: hypothetical protein HY711_10255 [Candidatus Melainabacteria bacterium]|nr:hypothetical protein [Candidatus Melainabacteria bacterium]
MHIMQPQDAYVLLVLFAVAMILATSLTSREHLWHTTTGFMAAGRKVPWWLGAVSISVSWIWAPALFVSVQQAYQQGIPGIFWFAFPNIICLIILAPLAVRIRKFLPTGYSQPEWIRHRFDNKTHKLYLVAFFWYQLMAITVQLYAGGSIFSLLTGVSTETTMVVLAITTLTYGAISGMRASIITDFIQYALIIACGALIIPWTIAAAGGPASILAGLGGVTGHHLSLFDGEVAFNFGIVTTIGLISGVLADQQHWQRAFTIDEKHLVRAYIVAGMLFGIVPLCLSTLGFLAANPSLGVSVPPGTDPSMIGVALVAHFLPQWAVVALVIMLLGGLCSTLDSGLCAASSLYALNCVPLNCSEQKIQEKHRLKQTLTSEELLIQQKLDRKIVGQGRWAMCAITLAGLLVSLCILYIPGFQLKYLWWIFNMVAACVAVPTILSLYWTKVDSKGVFWGTLTAFLLGMPLFVYSNIQGLIWLSVAASVGIIVVTTAFCLLFPRRESFKLAAPELSELPPGSN